MESRTWYRRPSATCQLVDSGKVDEALYEGQCLRYLGRHNSECLLESKRRFAHSNTLGSLTQIISQKELLDMKVNRQYSSSSLITVERWKVE